ncbi:hypothetical protein ISR94_02100 [Candidatus Microgenomates bacterium]|nr:hypothetical protein [Candidatus Microgenomates bacterium]
MTNEWVVGIVDPKNNLKRTDIPGVWEVPPARKLTPKQIKAELKDVVGTTPAIRNFINRIVK